MTVATTQERNTPVDQADGSDYAIQAVELNKFYGPKHVLKDVSFNVRKGEVVGFLGPNGAGKTTTMRILTGYMPPSSGEAQVAGYDVFEQSLQMREHIGYVPENVPLYQDMTVWDYIAFAARLHKVKAIDEAVERALELVNIEDRADTVIGRLSKGYKQRVGIAQAIVHQPDVLIMDEPTIGLDPKQIIEVRELIKGLGREHTILLSTHILPEVSQTCSRVLIIDNGEIVAEDTPQRLGSRVRGADQIHLQVLKPSPEIPGEIEKVQGVLAVHPREEGVYEIETTLNSDRRSEIAALAVQRGWGLLELRPVSVSLEDVFLHLTTREEQSMEGED